MLSQRLALACGVENSFGESRISNNYFDKQNQGIRRRYIHSPSTQEYQVCVFFVVVFLRNLFRTVYSYNNFSSSLPFEEVQSTFEGEIFDNYLIPFISADVSNGNIFYENKLSNFPGRTFADSLCPGPMSQGTEFSNFFLHALSFLNDEESDTGYRCPIF